MLRDDLRNNHVTLIGKLIVPPTFVCTHNGSKYYDGLVKVYRKSGSYDEVPITTTERLANAICASAREHPGADIVIEGKITTRGINLRTRTALRYPMVVEVEEVCLNLGKANPVNDVEIKGHLCENPLCRITPSGLKICELTIAIPKSHGRDIPQDYIRCITWNGTARFASRLYVGAFVKGVGRFQSREYMKILDNGSEVKRTAYEVSLYAMADARA